MHDEEATVPAFVAPNRVGRWVRGLASPKRRASTVQRLCHHHDWITRYATVLRPTGKRGQQLTLLAGELRARGTPADWRVVTVHADVDGQVMPLPNALDLLVDDGCALLICRPGELALRLPEAPEPPVLLARERSPEKSSRAGVATADSRGRVRAALSPTPPKGAPFGVRALGAEGDGGRLILTSPAYAAPRCPATVTPR